MPFKGGLTGSDYPFRDASCRGSHQERTVSMDIAVRIPTPIVEHDGRRPERCDRCGSQGFNLHQRATKALKDPLTLRADVIRFICKRCRKTTRLYPPGVDSARQTVALGQASVLLYGLGLSYDAIRELGAPVGCPLS